MHEWVFPRPQNSTGMRLIYFIFSFFHRKFKNSDHEVNSEIASNTEGKYKDRANVR